MWNGCFRPAVWLLVALILAAPFVPGASARSAMPTPAATAPTAHNPIVIEGDAGFTPANGVVSGSGTAPKPYILEGWVIDASSAVGIWIRNTSAYFVFRDSRVSGYLTSGFADIAFLNAAHGVVQNVSLGENAIGIDIVGGDALTVNATTVRSTLGTGIRSNGTRNLVVSGSNVTVSQGWAVSVLNVTGSLSWNSIVGAVFVMGSSGFMLDHNRVFDSTLGYWSEVVVRGSDGVSLLANNLTAASGGLALSDSPRATLRGNLLPRYGLLLQGAELVALDSQAITTDNLVQGKPLRYYAGTAGVVVDRLVTGQLILVNCTSATVANVGVDGGYAGITAWYVDGLEISSSWVNASTDGIRLWNVTHANVSHVRVAGGQTSGLDVRGSSNVTVSNVTFASLSAAASLTSSQDLRIQNTSVLDAGTGIVASDTRRLAITDSRFFVTYGGLYLASSQNVTLSGDAFETSGSANYQPVGIDGTSTSSVILTRSYVANFTYGVQLWYSTGWVVYANRFVNNTYPAYDGWPGANAWNASYPIGGNFWSNYVGYDDCGGPNQSICPGPDGFGDVPYVLGGGAEDDYPILYTSPQNVPPVAAFTVSPQPYYVSRGVTFNASGSHDPDGRVVSFAWDFGDGSPGAVQSSVTHVFGLPGTYTVTLTVTDNRRGTNSSSIHLAIQAPPAVPLVLWTSPNGYELPVPRDWTLHENYTSAGSTYDLFVEGIYDGTPANLLADVTPDPTAQETDAYVLGIMNDSVASVRLQYPNVVLGNAAVRQLSGHEAVTFVLRYGPAMYQDLALVTDASLKLTWLIILTAAGSEEAFLNGTFQKIVEGFVITAASPGGSNAGPLNQPWSLWADIAVVVASAAAAVGIAAWLLVRRRKKSAAEPGPSLPPPPAEPPKIP